MVSKTHLHQFLIPYRGLLAMIDQQLDCIRRRYSAQIACHKGCNCGCRNLSVFPIEALSLAHAMQDLPAGTAARIRKRAENASFWECPLLEDRACKLYAFRPVICRTHGFPLQTVYNQRLSIGHCPRNFKNMSSIPDDAVIDLDRINRVLRTINASAASEMAPGLQLQDRLTVAQALLLEAF